MAGKNKTINQIINGINWRRGETAQFGIMAIDAVNGEKNKGFYPTFQKLKTDVDQIVADLEKEDPFNELAEWKKLQRHTGETLEGLAQLEQGNGDVEKTRDSFSMATGNLENIYNSTKIPGAQKTLKPAYDQWFDLSRRIVSKPEFVEEA